MVVGGREGKKAWWLGVEEEEEVWWLEKEEKSNTFNGYGSNWIYYICPF